jgi:hypothetical protein
MRNTVGGKRAINERDITSDILNHGVKDLALLSLALR